MDDATGMSVRQCAGNFLEEARGCRMAERTSVTDALPKGLAVHVSHHEEHEIPDLVHGEDRNDPRMGELRRGARLPQEAVPRGRLAGALGVRPRDLAAPTKW